MFDYKKYLTIQKKWYHAPFLWTYNVLKFFWDACHSANKFSWKRFLVAFISFVVFLYIFLNSLGFIVDSVKYVLTARVNEIVYLSSAQEISEDTYAVKGCEAKECSIENSLSFRIESNAFAQVWSLTNKGILFYPDYVAAIVAPEIRECTVTSYGTRWKFLIRNWNIYPEILDVSCK
jgi:hypothetical protein